MKALKDYFERKQEILGDNIDKFDTHLKELGILSFNQLEDGKYYATLDGGLIFPCYATVDRTFKKDKEKLYEEYPSGQSFMITEPFLSNLEKCYFFEISKKSAIKYAKYPISNSYYVKNYK